jgi:capreomycidine synthase
LSSSGVAPYSFAELRRLAAVELDELDELVLGDGTSLGGVDLRRALANRFAGGDTTRVMGTSGSSEAVFLVLSALVAPGDDVVVLNPTYHSLASAPLLAGARLRVWPLGDAGEFVADVERGCRAISPSTSAVVVNFPHNPTGVSLSRQEQEQLVAAVDEIGAFLVWDGAFNELVYEGSPLPDPTSLSPNAVTIGTLSKAYGLPGLRVGWCIARPDVLARTIGLRDATTLFLSPLVERLAQRVVENMEAFVSPRLETACRNLHVLEAWVEEHSEIVRWTPPRGGVSAFLHLPSIDDVRGFCRRLASEADVLLVPGDVFGYPSHVRLGFGGDRADFERGLDRISCVALAASRRAAAGPAQRRALLDTE